MKNRLIRESWKAVYQNQGAAALLGGYFEKDEVLAPAIELARLQNNNIALAMMESSVFKEEFLRSLLEINARFRALYDTTVFRESNFDDQFVPILGWSKWLNETTSRH
jgi:hypothetical protein